MKLNLFLLSAAALSNAAQAEDVFVLVGDLGGQVLVPGTYTAGACALNGALLLDDNGVTDPTWTFECSAAFVGAAAVSVSFKSLGSADNVNWEIGAAIGVGAGSSMIGNLNAVGALTIGANSEWTGNLHTDAAISVGADSTMNGNLNSVGAMVIGANFECNGDLTTDAAIGIGADSTLNGDVTAFAAITIGANTIYTGSLTSTSGAAITLGVGTVPGTVAGSKGDPHCKFLHAQYFVASAGFHRLTLQLTSFYIYSHNVAR
jgi:cytoskeletal protein CcmA (bactofilin family)